MNAPDLVTMISNLSQSLLPVQSLLAGLSYVVGLLFIINSFHKFKEVIDGGSSHTKMVVPIANLVMGALMLFLPSSLQVLSNTAFGSSSILQYSTYNAYDIYGSMRIVIQTAGLIWFARGCALLVHAGEPGGQQGSKGMGPKGLTFIAAGIFAMNLDATVSMLDYILNSLMSITWNKPPQ